MAYKLKKREKLFLKIPNILPKKNKISVLVPPLYRNLEIPIYAPNSTPPLLFLWILSVMLNISPLSAWNFMAGLWVVGSCVIVHSIIDLVIALDCLHWPAKLSELSGQVTNLHRTLSMDPRDSRLRPPTTEHSLARRHAGPGSWSRVIASLGMRCYLVPRMSCCPVPQQWQQGRGGGVD